MKMRVAAIAGVLALLSGCDKEEAFVGNGAAEAGATATAIDPGTVPDSAEGKPTSASGSTEDKLTQALTCWGLTNRAYFTHQAIAGGGGNLPNPKPQIYRAWGNLAATTANGAGMTLSAFQSAQNKAQQAATVYSLDVKPEHAAAVQKCIDTAPALGPDPELKWTEE